MEKDTLLEAPAQATRDARPTPGAAPAPPHPAPAGMAAATTIARPKSKRPFLILGAVLGVVLIAVALYMLLTHGEQGTDDAQISADIVGIAPRVAGQVVKVTIHEDQQVKKGQILVEIDDADYKARVQQAQAEKATAQAQADAADAQASVVEAGSRGGYRTAQAAMSGSAVSVAQADANIAAAKAAVSRSDADAERARMDLKRAEELFKANAVPQQTLDNARIQAQVATAAQAQARAQLTASEEMKRGAVSRVGEAEGRMATAAPVDKQIAAARAQAALAHARVQSADAQLQLAQLQLSYTKVAAPEDGTASRLTAREGMLVQPGQPLVELVPNRTYVVANFKETQIGDMKIGDKADITIDAYGHKTFHGHVESLSAGTGAVFSLLPPDNASGNFVKVVQRVPVRVAWDDAPDVAMRAGLSADVTVHVAH